MIAWRIVGVGTYWDEENAMPGPNMVYKQLVKKKKLKVLFVWIISAQIKPSLVFCLFMLQKNWNVEFWIPLAAA